MRHDSTKASRIPLEATKKAFRATFVVCPNNYSCLNMIALKASRMRLKPVFSDLNFWLNMVFRVLFNGGFTTFHAILAFC